MRVIAELMSRELLYAYAEGGLTEPEREGVEAYLMDHPEARAELKAYVKRRQPCARRAAPSL